MESGCGQIWILVGMAPCADAYPNGTLMWLTDSSYDKKWVPKVSEVGWIGHDSMSSHRLTCLFVEISPLASSYFMVYALFKSFSECHGLYSIQIFFCTLYTFWACKSSSNRPLLWQQNGITNIIQKGGAHQKECNF
jgi:hypothetical protein